MILYQEPYIRVRAKDFSGSSYFLLQLDSPQLIGIIRTFKNTQKDEEARRAYLASSNPYLTAKVDQYRIYCHPYGSCLKLGGQMPPEELRGIMAEMAAFYLSELPDEKREELKEKEHF